MTELPQDILKMIAEGNGHVYNYEGKSMAVELLKWRAKEAAAQIAAAPAPTPPILPWP